MSEGPQRLRLGPIAGVQGPAEAFALALARGRMHHAWLLTGPKGLGKAQFAWRMARRLLGARPVSLDEAETADDPEVRLIAARAHPDLLALERETEDGKPRRTIPVDEVRRLPEFFAKAPARSPWRVAIVDSVDDLAEGGANALLKTLEEPPPRGVLLLVSHAPGRLLPTLRSRCRRLSFPPWSDAALEAWLGGPPDAAARGSPGAALAARGRTSAAEAVLQGLGQGRDEAALVRLADGFRGPEGAERFAAVLQDVSDAVRLRLSTAADQGRPASEPWFRAWEMLDQTASRVEALNLDRGDAFWMVLDRLRAASRTHPLPP